MVQACTWLLDTMDAVINPRCSTVAVTSWSRTSSGRLAPNRPSVQWRIQLSYHALKLVGCDTRLVSGDRLQL